MGGHVGQTTWDGPRKRGGLIYEGRSEAVSREHNIQEEDRELHDVTKDA